MWPITRAGKIDLLVPTEDTTGQGKLTVGKLYGGVLIYEIWKTTRFRFVDDAGNLWISSMTRYV